MPKNSADALRWNADPERRQKWLSYQKEKYELDKMQNGKKPGRNANKNVVNVGIICNGKKLHQALPWWAGPSPPSPESCRAHQHRKWRETKQTQKTIGSLEHRLHDQQKKTKLCQKTIKVSKTALKIKMTLVLCSKKTFQNTWIPQNICKRLG